MIVSSNLAKGAIAMSRRKVIVKRLNAIQNFGAMDVLCTDKTDALTQDNIFLEHHLDVSGVKSGRVLMLAWLNSSSQSGCPECDGSRHTAFWRGSNRTIDKSALH